MNNYCIHLKKRKGKPFCKLLNKEIKLFCCQECVNKEYKTKNEKNSFYKTKPAKKQQIIKKRSKKLAKEERNRFSIITNDLAHCLVCGAKRDNLHEVFYGSYRHISIKYGLVIPLCLNHHTMGEFAIHNDIELDLYFKRLAQTIFISKYSYELFIKEFKIDYLSKTKKEEQDN